MSKASEWATKYEAVIRPATAEMPKIQFQSEQYDGSEYTVCAHVAFLDATGEPILTFSASRPDHPVALRADNAVKLAHWLLATFGDDTAGVSLAS